MRRVGQLLVAIILTLSLIPQKGIASCNIAISAKDTTNEDVIERIKNAIEENAELYLEEGTIDYISQIEDILEYLDFLKNNPLNINSASKRELEKLGILTPFQIISLLKHISLTGAILSFAELSLLQGFDENLVMMLKPFIYLGDKRESYKPFFKELNSSIYARYYTKYSLLNNQVAEDKRQDDGKYKFTKDYLNVRYIAKYSNKAEATFIVKKDSGEPIIGKNRLPYSDFLSGGLALYNLKVRKTTIDNLIIGDFNAKFGQGLTLWNSKFFIEGKDGFQKSGEPLSLYTSSDEYNFLRGVALTASYKNLSLSTLFSYKGVDATLNDNGTYKSIKKDGKHTSLLLIKAQNSMHEMVLGINSTLLLNKVKFGFSYVGSLYDRLCGVKRKNYNMYKLYDGYQQVVGLDFYSVLGQLRVFGEGAYSFIGGASALLGGTLSLNKWDFSFLARYYSKEFLSPHAGAYSSISDVNNQLGVSVRGMGKIYKNIKMSSGVDYTYYPWYRYNINAPSSLYKMFIHFSWSNEKNFQPPTHEILLKVNYRESAIYSKIKSIKRLWSVTLKAKSRLFPFADISSRFTCNSTKSYMVAPVVSITLFNNKFVSHIGFTLYSVPSWDGRIYLIEKDLPLTFSSNLIYREGADLYGVFSLKINKKLSLYCKLQQRREILNCRFGAKAKF